MTHPLFRREFFIETAFERRFQAFAYKAWLQHSWHIITADPGGGKSMGTRDMVKRAGKHIILAVVAPKNNDDEQALGDLFFTALGQPLQGNWKTRKPKLMGHLHRAGTQCLIVDDAHDLSLEHLLFIKELTDQGCLQYDHPLGLCLVAAARGNTIPLKETLDQPDLTWLQFRRRLGKIEPFVKVASHTSEEVREILVTLETIYREAMPQLNLLQWSSYIYTVLTQPALDPTHTGRVTMDNLMKLVTTALELSYDAHHDDVRADTLKQAAELIVLRRDTLRLIDGPGQKLSDLFPHESEPSPTPPDETRPEDDTTKGNDAQTEKATEETAELEEMSAGANCPFSGVVEIDLQRFLESPTQVVECPGCGRTRTLTPVKGTLRFKAHTPRKKRAALTGKRWAAQDNAEWGIAGD